MKSGCTGRLAALLLLAAASAYAEAPVVVIDSGAVQGSQQAGVQAFKGIPYARPPVGELRWRAPQAVPAWQGVRAAVEYGADCMQQPFPGDAAPNTAPLSENCLFVNVWRPAGAVGAKRPVMVWIYGGGFVNGGSSPAVYSGSEFARDGIVFVSFNYRVGRFGFFAHPALSHENPDKGMLGNYGLMDQLAALRWVRNNIAAFGGDPGNVTVFGESAGGFSVGSLLTSPLAAGLFHKAIIESGSGRHNLVPGQTLAQAEQAGLAFAASVRVHGTDAAALASLRRLPAADLVAGLNMATMRVASYSGPMVDGTLITGEPQDIYRSGRFNRVPLIVGANEADLGFPPPAASVAQAIAPLGAAHRAAALRAYDPAGTATAGDVAQAIASDAFMLEPPRFIARTVAALGVPVWQYRFGYVADSMHGEWAGAVHASEIPYVFDTLPARYGAATTARDRAVASLMHRYWINFASSGKPDGADLPAWLPYTPQRDNLMRIAPQGVQDSGDVADPWRARLDLVRILNENR
ncbi:carboxylesterase/lipase family protein [Paludibacterium yongneupense]|uniref:carboxylesterase/lipase family protein n=1 Tax=Paludibacterium yongneupense TaxID=400061 RepID=UPI00041B7869|nr:carboxylesterase family protein [Paludibacterium yongneupense]